MDNFRRIFIILCIILMLIIIFSFGKYFYKYYIITKFQRKIEEIEEIGNYKFVDGNIIVYTKDNIYVEKMSDTMYIIINQNTNERKLLTPDGVQELESTTVYSTISSDFSIKNSNTETTLWNIKKYLKYSKLTLEFFENKECYKLFFVNEERPYGFTVYFEKKTYMPIAYCYEDEDIIYVQITTNIVQDEDVSEDTIIQKIMELSN